MKGWVGWVRGQYLQRYLSNYDVTLTDSEGFEEMYNKGSLNFDLYYPLFHPMILWKSIKYLIETNQKVITLVTGNKVISFEDIGLVLEVRSWPLVLIHDEFQMRLFLSILHFRVNN